MTFAVIKEDDGYLLRIEGPMTMAEIQALNKVAWEDRDWDSHHYEIWDFLNADASALLPEDAYLAARMDNAAYRRTGHIRIAIIATSPKVLELCQVYIGGSDLGVENIFFVESEGSARDKLGLSTPKTTKVLAG